MSKSTTWTTTASRILTHPATARAAMKAVESMARRVANPPTNDWIDAGLHSVGLRREPSTGELIGQALQYIAAGAALGAGATMATPPMRPVVNDAVNVAGSWASDAASQSRQAMDQLRSMAIDRGDDALALVGLQRVPSVGRRIITTSAWIGLGIGVGMAVGSIMNEMSKRDDVDTHATDDEAADDQAQASTHTDGHDADSDYAHVH